MANTVWPNADPIGQCLIVGADTMPCTRVVGVAENTRRSRLREDPSMHYYLPLGQEVGFGGAMLLVSGPGDVRALIPGVQRKMLELDPTVTYVDMERLQEQIEPQVRPWRLGASVFAMSGVLALLVAAVGIYSVMSYLIADRRHEIGVRMALGADGTSITALVLRGSLVMALVGVVIGELLATLASRFVQPLLFDTSARDLSVFGAVGVLLVTVAVLATLVPAMRARRVNPMEALRAE
jgi:ABC-type antimicrobial peptide transport system permease subunit